MFWVTTRVSDFFNFQMSTIQLPLLTTAFRYINIKGDEPQVRTYFGVLWYVSREDEFFEIMPEPHVIDTSPETFTKLSPLFQGRSPFRGKDDHSEDIDMHRHRPYGFYPSIAEATRAIGMPLTEWFVLKQNSNPKSLVPLSVLMLAGKFENPRYITSKDSSLDCLSELAGLSGSNSSEKQGLDFLKCSRLVQIMTMDRTIDNVDMANQIRQLYDCKTVSQDAESGEEEGKYEVVQVRSKLKEIRPADPFASFFSLSVAPGLTIRLAVCPLQTSKQGKDANADANSRCSIPRLV